MSTRSIKLAYASLCLATLKVFILATPVPYSNVGQGEKLKKISLKAACLPLYSLLATLEIKN